MVGYLSHNLYSDASRIAYWSSQGLINFATRCASAMVGKNRRAVAGFICLDATLANRPGNGFRTGRQRANFQRLAEVENTAQSHAQALRVLGG